MEDVARPVWVEGIDAQWLKTAEAAVAAGARARAREEGEREEGQWRTAPGGDKKGEDNATWCIPGAARRRRRVARRDACSALTGGKTGWSSLTEKFLANGFDRVSLTNDRD